MSSVHPSFSHIQEALLQQSMLEDKSWMIAPEAWGLDARTLSELESIGQACMEFLHAHEQLYRFSVEGHNLLRNGTFHAPWVAEYLDRGKPAGLIEHGLREEHRGNIPCILRPDLILTEDGFALTELDTIPNGIGLTAFLNRLYRELGESTLGEGDAMIAGFYETLAALREDRDAPLVAIVVSEEAATYRPEFRWLAQELRKLGKPVYCVSPQDIMPLGNTLCVPVDGNPEKIDILYRQFELYDLRNVATADNIFEAVEAGEVVVTPAMRGFQEEKLSLALFHHPLLEQYWREHLSRRSYKLLRKLIPRAWIVDPVDLPPTAVLHAPLVGGLPIVSWEQLGNASQRERNLILKISGFHPDAREARSVVLGSDVSREEWSEALAEAVEESNYALRLLQEYRKPHRVEHQVCDEQGRAETIQGRVRLCPYYYVHGRETSMPGVLATVCPADKKIIHGMSEAAMLPCKVLSTEALKEKVTQEV